MRASRRILAVLAISFAQVAIAQPPDGTEIGRAEALIDAFYSFDHERLTGAMSSAPASAPVILYYQGWAKGGGYKVVHRKPCVEEKPDHIRCDITVKDDLIAALGTGYDVTDSFHITFRNKAITEVRTSSNDPPEFERALKWLASERPDLMDGPCRGFFKGGPTPEECVKEVVKGFRLFGKR